MSKAMGKNKKPEIESLGAEDPDVITDLTNPDVVTKYRQAADIANAAMKIAQKLVVAGAKIVDICIAADASIVTATGKIYTKNSNGKKVEKGVAFPTSISVNHIVGHFTPLSGDEAELKAGDVVKIDLGVQVDGYIALSATTVAVPTDGEKITGRAADVMMAAHTAAEAAVRMVKVGNTNTQVTEVIAKSAAAFKCEPVQGVLSHSMSRFSIDGENVIIGKQEVEHKVDEFTFEPNSIFAVDIVMSTGEGKTKETSERTTVYKRVPDTTYQLKMKASRYVFSEVNKNHTVFPFTIRELDEKQVRFGITECHKHGLVQAYPILAEKDDELVAHMKFTVLLTETGKTVLCMNSVNTVNVQSEYKVEDADLKAVMNMSAGGAKKNKKKKKKKTGDAEKKE